MISVDKVREIVMGFLATESGVELVDITVSANNVIVVTLDSYEGVDLDLCGALTHYVTERLDRDEEDYELEVGSVSLTDPFRSRMQYEKNVGHEVEVLTQDGKKLRGVLVNVEEDSFAVDIEEMVKVEGKKRKQKQITTYTWRYDEVVSVRYLLKI